MKYTSLFIVIVILHSACSEDENASLKKEDLFGSWKVFGQTRGNKTLEPFTQIYLVTDEELNTTRDTIIFKDAIFEFTSNNSSGFVLGDDFNLRFQQRRIQQGFWLFNESAQMIVFTPKLLISDTSINNHLYQKWKFIEYLENQEPKRINNNLIKLINGDDVLFLERIK